MALKIKVEVFWVVILYSAVVEYQCFGGPYFPLIYSISMSMSLFQHY